MKLFSIKPASTAYTSNMLPKNRREVFGDIFRLHFGKFLGMGLLILCCSLPIHLGAFLVDGYIGSGDSGSTATVQLQNLQQLINIPLLMLLALPLSGLLRVLRQYAWGENVFFSYDFPKGIRQNGVQTIAIAFVGGTTFMLATVSLRMAAAGGIMNYMALIPMGLFLLLIFPICCYMLAATAVYSNSLVGNLKVALLVYSKVPFQTLLTLACFCGVYLIVAIPNLYCHIVGRLLGSLLTPALLFAWNLFCYNRFDKYINQTEHPELLNKGVLGLQYHDR